MTSSQPSSPPQHSKTKQSVEVRRSVFEDYDFQKQYTERTKVLANLGAMETKMDLYFGQAIILNLFVIAFETEYSGDGVDPQVFFFLELIFLSIFSFELVWRLRNFCV